MKNFSLLLSMFLLLLFTEKNTAQNLVCNDLVFIALDEDCSHTLTPEQMLEGFILSDCIVELDKTAPFGDGPWVAPVLTGADIGIFYQARVTHVPSGNKCWGNIKAEDKLPPVLDCSSITTVHLNDGSLITLDPLFDLNISMTENCGTASLAPAILQYDCSDQGLNTVTLTATDQSGNTATCQHHILVTDIKACLPCVSNCPPSTVVTYDAGVENLLPAFNNNDLSVFDVFGNALFDSNCSPYIDSFYIVDYQPPLSGYAGFTRQWWWLQSNGQPTVCTQQIVFPATHEFSVQGQIYLDTDNDCNYDAGEQGVRNYRLLVTKLPSGVTEYIYPSNDGSYSQQISMGIQDVSFDLQLILPAFVNAGCPTAINVLNASANADVTFNIGLQSAGNCPMMQVDLGDLFLRRCATNLLTLKYCNMGLDTAYGAFATLDLDSLITLQSASLPYTVSGPEDLYTFQLGNVPPFFCGTIYMYAHIDCGAEPGQTLCNEAHIFPDEPCNGAWQGPLITATAECAGDSVSLELKNSGGQNMGTELNYIVVEDFIMYKSGTFKLNAGETFTVKTPANGATWRIEADQIPGYPVIGGVAMSLEGCGGVNTPGLINIFGDSDNAIPYDRNCGEVRASCDPNDKTAVPVGFGEEHFIRANGTIDYKIRFQNTGNDTAFKVVVVDTLSPLLDVRSLELGAASHPYRLDIYPGGILHFVFDPISLPDSNVNEVASHGYLKFKVAQQPDLPDGTRIENTAAIYFDTNDPVFTNTAFHTIGYPFVNPDPLISNIQTNPVSCYGLTDGAIHVTPAGGVTPYTFAWSDPALQGDSLNGLAAGMYSLTITDRHGHELVQLIEVTQPALLTLDAYATPTLGNDNNGTASAQVSGGTAPYTYLWSNQAATADISGLAAGTYGLTATDANGCTQSAEALVEQNVLPLLFSGNFINPGCHDGTNGAIDLSVTGGLQPYTFQWSRPDMQGSSPNGLGAGLYGLTLTDSYGNEIIQTFELTQPEALVIDLSSTASTGNDQNGTATAQVSGGTAPYTYLWSNGVTTPAVSGLFPGLYTLQVSDANGCTQSAAVTVTQMILPLLFTSNSTNPSCHDGSDGSIRLFVSGGLPPYTYQWSDGNLQGDTQTGLSAGTYEVSVSDSNGSQFVEIFHLTEPAAIDILMSSGPAHNGQSDGTAAAQATGGSAPYTYLWNNGSTTMEISGLTAGTYTVTLSDANGCTASNSVVVEQTVATGEATDRFNILVWPNPANDRIHLDLQRVLPELLRLDLLGADGRLFRHWDLEDLQPQMTVTLGNDVSKGLLLLVCYGRDGGIYTEKIVLE